MLKSEHELLTELKAALTNRQYSPVAIRNYCAYAQEFLDYLVHRGIPVAEVTEDLVEQYLRHATALFRKRRGRRPSKRWHEVPQSGIHALLRLGQGQWPPAPKVASAADALRFTICSEYANTKLGFARSVVLLGPASTRSCGKPATSFPGNSTGAGSRVSRE